MKREFVKQINSLGINIDEISLYFVVNGIAGLYVDCLKNNVKIDYSKLEIKTKEFIRKNIDILEKTKFFSNYLQILVNNDILSK